MNLKLKQLLLTLSILHLFALATAAQNVNGRWGVPQKPYTCAQTAMEMETVQFLLEKEPNPKGKLVIIARLGAGEIRRFLNKQRLFSIAERYKVLGIPAEKIVVAEGERINDFGRVEIYWNGELLGALLAEKNRGFGLNCYENDEKLYPVLREVKQKK